MKFNFSIANGLLMIVMLITLTLASLVDQVIGWHLLFLSICLVMIVYGRRTEGVVAIALGALAHDAVWLYPLGLSFVVVGLALLIFPLVIQVIPSRIGSYSVGLIVLAMIFLLIDEGLKIS